MTPMTPLTDDQLDTALGGFLRAEAEAIGARAQGERIAVEALRRRVGGSPSRRSWILLAAALLVTSAAAVGLTVGAATLRERSPSAPMPSALEAVPFPTLVLPDAVDEVPPQEAGCPWPDTWARPMMSRTQFQEHCRR